MKRSRTSLAEPVEIAEQNQGVLSRWSKRKQAVLQEQQENEALAEQASQAEKLQAEEDALPTDEDMPPIESLTPESDFTGFMSPKVSERLRRLALRKLFHSPEFNIRDGLDEYDGDYTSFEKLGDIVTCDMKHQIEMEAQREMEALEQQQLQLQAEADDLATLESEPDLTPAVEDEPQVDAEISEDGVSKIDEALESEQQSEVLKIPNVESEKSRLTLDTLAEQKSIMPLILPDAVIDTTEEIELKQHENEQHESEFDDEDDLDLDGGVAG